MLSQQDQEMRRNVPDPSFAGGSHFCGSGAGNETSLAAVTISLHLFSTNQMLLAGIRANSIHSLRELSHANYALWQWISFWLEIEPLDAERVAVGSKDHSLVSSLKERVSRRNLISQTARPGVDILSRFLNV